MSISGMVFEGEYGGKSGALLRYAQSWFILLRGGGKEMSRSDDFKW